MHSRSYLTAAALGTLLLAGAPLRAEDDPTKSDPPASKATDSKPAAAAPRIIAVGDGVARFEMLGNSTDGSLTLRLLEEPTVQLGGAPVLLLETPGGGTREVTLVAVAGQRNAWRAIDPAFRTDAVKGNVRILVAGRTYLAPLPMGAIATHGGSIVTFTSCGSAYVEVVRDPKRGTLTLYVPERMDIGEPALVLATAKSGGKAGAAMPCRPTHEDEGTSPAANDAPAVQAAPSAPAATPEGTIAFRPADGTYQVWTVTHANLRGDAATTASFRVRAKVNGSSCEAPLVLATAAGTGAVAAHGGRILIVEGGPRIEMVSDPSTRTYRFYAVDEKVDGRVYTIENPRVIVTTIEGPRTIELRPIEGQPRAWELVGSDVEFREPFDGRLQFTLFGRTLETHLGVSGAGINVR